MPSLSLSFSRRLPNIRLWLEQYIFSASHAPFSFVSQSFCEYLERKNDCRCVRSVWFSLVRLCCVWFCFVSCRFALMFQVCFRVELVCMPRSLIDGCQRAAELLSLFKMPPTLCALFPDSACQMNLISFFGVKTVHSNHRTSLLHKLIGDRIDEMSLKKLADSKFKHSLATSKKSLLLHRLEKDFPEVIQHLHTTRRHFRHASFWHFYLESYGWVSSSARLDLLSAMKRKCKKCHQLYAPAFLFAQIFSP